LLVLGSHAHLRLPFHFPHPSVRLIMPVNIVNIHIEKLLVSSHNRWWPLMAWRWPFLTRSFPFPLSNCIGASEVLSYYLREGRERSGRDQYIHKLFLWIMNGSSKFLYI
jgi:hypothetical protein